MSVVKNKEEIAVGDFNIPCINWDFSSGDHEGNRLTDYFLNLMIYDPTRW